MRSPAMTMASLPDLYREIRSYQGRLGTNAELPGDFERVLRLAHDINNQISVHYMRATMENPAVTPRLGSMRQWLNA